MIRFGFLRSITASIRWLSHFPLSPLSGFLLLSPPFIARQVVVDLTRRSVFSIRIGSYFDWATIHEIFVRLEYETKFFQLETEIQKHYAEILESGKTPLILDLGANVGMASIFFSLKYPGARVIGLEPDEGNANLASSNLASFPTTEVICAAVSSKDGEISLFDPGLGNNAFRTFGHETESVGKIRAVGISSLFAQHASSAPFIVKIDVEGFEDALFKEDTSWIDSVKVLAIEIHDWMMPGQAVSSNLLKALGGKNRDLVFRGENLFSVRND